MEGKPLTLPSNSIVFNSDEIGSLISPNLIKPIDQIYSQNPNKKERSFKLLGVLLDENLTFNDNTDCLCNKLAKSMFVLNQSKNFLTLRALKLFTSHYLIISFAHPFTPSVLH
jgi:hypothetical protein